jgi:hypothetical protein
MAKLIEGVAQSVAIMRKLHGEEATRRWCQHNLHRPSLTFDGKEVYRAENGRTLAEFSIPGFSR